MDLQLAGRRAVVTGASKGIGAAIADVLAAEGVNLVLVSRTSPPHAQALRDRYGVKVEVITADLSTPEGRQAVVQHAQDVDILVNNAGAIPGGGLLDVHEGVWREAWDLKVYGFLFLSQGLYPALARSGHGVILNIIGVASEILPAGYLAGAVGNSALVAFTKAAAKNSWRDGVRLVGINPGGTLTERQEVLLRTRAATELGDAERWLELTSELPFGRSASPAEIANAAAFLVSPLSAYTNGTVLTIDGGNG
ncbi:short-chain dehydrogenase/reductase [Kutzneria sp. 744]|uniref:short-chain dehydrogenase/reductase n=1 Tax=Kutzneria sp. (strain 744) TaxID=345341 RepID=UPI0003EEC5D9|nr:short-chain dehydrogenase/reductase [Kutzneria sp. 744]EWM17894.1 3-oxoacyl-[acyl-carrier-protein] reductase [Kutzneria sp. 744]